jgi:hypothetical protein
MQHNLNNDLGEIEIELDQMSVIFNINSLFFFCILTLTIDYKKTDYTGDSEISLEKKPVIGDNEKL